MRRCPPDSPPGGIALFVKTDIVRHMEIIPISLIADLLPEETLAKFAGVEFVEFDASGDKILVKAMSRSEAGRAAARARWGGSGGSSNAALVGNSDGSGTVKSPRKMNREEDVAKLTPGQKQQYDAYMDRNKAYSKNEKRTPQMVHEDAMGIALNPKSPRARGGAKKKPGKVGDEAFMAEDKGSKRGLKTADPKRLAAYRRASAKAKKNKTAPPMYPGGSDQMAIDTGGSSLSEKVGNARSRSGRAGAMNRKDNAAARAAGPKPPSISDVKPGMSRSAAGRAAAANRFGAFGKSPKSES